MNNVLWTGGWDSTFRILSLVLLEQKIVQPYYVKDEGRRSTATELQVMLDIREMVRNLDAEAADRIMTSVVIEKRDIPRNDSISAKYKKLLSQSHLGSQYDWLARYADSMGLKNLELCIHRDDKAEGFIADMVEYVASSEDGPHYKMKPTHDSDPLSLFKYFNFPILDLTKLDMAQRADAGGFSHIMESTWFCFNPTSDRQPCGLCYPCKYTKEEGLGRRVPKPSLLRIAIHRSKQLVRKAKSYILHRG